MITRKTFVVSITAFAAFASIAFAVEPASPAADRVSSTTASDPIDRLAARVKRSLHLTDAQASAVAEVVRRHRPDVQPLRERARIERDELRVIVARQPLDEGALEAQATKMAATTKALTLATARLRADLRSILTPEQIDTVMRARRAVAERRQHRREAAPATP